MSSVQNNNQNNFLPNIFGQSLDVVLINALFDTQFACNSVTNILLSALKAIGKFGMIIVIKSLFSGESFKIENLFQKLLRIIFYKKIVLNDQKIVTEGNGKIVRTYEKEFQEYMKEHRYTEHPDTFSNKNGQYLIDKNNQISYLNYVHAKFGSLLLSEEEKKINEQLKNMTKKVQKISKPPYQRKYEKEFQEMLKKCGAAEHPDPFANKTINKLDYNNISYLNWVNTCKGKDKMEEEEKNMLEDQNSKSKSDYIQVKTHKISKPKYKRKYEEGFQKTLSANNASENPDPFADKNSNDVLIRQRKISYLNYVHGSQGENEMLKEEKHLINSNTENNEDTSEDYFFYTTIKDIFSKKEEPKEPFPVYFNNNILEYFPYFHNQFINVTKKKANQAYLESKKVPEGQTRCIKINTSGGMNVNYTPTKLFPSKNYKKLEKMITSYFEVCDITQTYEPLYVLINGIPGLGKTKFIDHFASLNIAELIGKIDMTEQTQNNFDKIFSSIISQQNHQGKTIILIDELDKYLDQYIKKEIEFLKSNGLKKVDPNDKEKKGIDFTEEDFKNRKISIKEDLLYTLLRISEYDGFTHPVVILFVANNFDTIYEGVDLTHFKSLQTRLFKVSFESCDKQEIIEYLKYYNNNFINTDFYEPDVEKLVDDIPDDIDIVYRDLKDISFKSSYKIKDIINFLKKYEKESKN